MAKSLIGKYALTSTVAQFAVNTATQFVALEAFGYFRFVVEEQRTMTWGEFGQMSAQNVIMMPAMTAAMKPMEPMLKGLEGELTSSFGRFARRYGTWSVDLATRRAALETAVKQRMESRPTAGKDDVADLTVDAAALDGELNRLADTVRADPTIDLLRMADELSGVMEKTAATTVLELLTGLDPAVDLQPTGDPTSWSFASGKGGQLAAFLRDGGYPMLTEQSGGGVRP